jgi:peptidoglycan hydrolase-like protein with peptidoglycan-binding domain
MLLLAVASAVAILSVGLPTASAASAGPIPGDCYSPVYYAIGMHGPCVAWAQREINVLSSGHFFVALPFPHLVVDGVFGPMTLSAIQRFQFRCNVYRGHAAPVLSGGRLDYNTVQMLATACA